MAAKRKAKRTKRARRIDCEVMEVTASNRYKPYKYKYVKHYENTPFILSFLLHKISGKDDHTTQLRHEKTKEEASTRFQILVEFPYMFHSWINYSLGSVCTFSGVPHSRQKHSRNPGRHRCWRRTCTLSSGTLENNFILSVKVQKYSTKDPFLLI